MSFMDIWALLTGVLTIISFLLVYADRFPKYTGTFKALMAFFSGFAVSRVLFPYLPTPGGSGQFSVWTLLATALIVSVGLLILYAFKRGDNQFVMWVMLFFLLPLFNGIGTFLKTGGVEVPPADYLILAQQKEQLGDFSAAAEYFQRYLDKANDRTAEPVIKKKIEALKLKQIERATNH